MDRPTLDELLEAVGEFLEKELLPIILNFPALSARSKSAPPMAEYLAVMPEPATVPIMCPFTLICARRRFRISFLGIILPPGSMSCSLYIMFLVFYRVVGEM